MKPCYATNLAVTHFVGQPLLTQLYMLKHLCKPSHLKHCAFDMSSSIFQAGILFFVIDRFFKETHKTTLLAWH